MQLMCVPKRGLELNIHSRIRMLLKLFLQQVEDNIIGDIENKITAHLVFMEFKLKGLIYVIFLIYVIANRVTSTLLTSKILFYFSNSNKHVLFSILTLFSQ